MIAMAITNPPTPWGKKPTISTGLLTAAGQAEGRTGFNIQLSNCVGAAATAAAFFNSGATVDPITGNLNNMTGTATNVQLQLVDAQGGAVIQAGGDGRQGHGSHGWADNAVYGDGAGLVDQFTVEIDGAIGGVGELGAGCANQGSEREGFDLHGATPMGKFLNTVAMR